MANMPFTCRDCEDRYPGCHAKCKKYKRESEIWEKEKARRKMEQEVRDYFCESAGRNANKSAVHKKGRSGRKWYSYGQ